MSGKPVASLSLDLDNKWSYLKTHGTDAWKSFPSYFDLVVPRIIRFFGDHEAKITFFVVGQDAALDKNRDALGRLSEAGHEIASHSFNHEPWLHLYSEEELHKELAAAEEAIKAATGADVRGFRGPGFSTSELTLKVLKARGYHFDATAFPNILNPLARAYFFARSNLSEEEKEQRKGLFGSYADAFRPVKPYRWTVDGDHLLEIPVTTMPLFKVPFHFSYLLYLASYSKVLSLAYFRFALGLCRFTGTEPSLLLHPLDFLGGDDDEDLAFFPAMNMSGADKVALMHRYVELLQKRFDTVTMGEHVMRYPETRTLTAFAPEFRHLA